MEGVGGPPDTDILTTQMQVEMAEGAKALAEASRQVARDVAAGKYRTAQEAKTNLREALRRGWGISMG